MSGRGAGSWKPKRGSATGKPPFKKQTANQEVLLIPLTRVESPLQIYFFPGFVDHQTHKVISAFSDLPVMYPALQSLEYLDNDTGLSVKLLLRRHSRAKKDTHLGLLLLPRIIR